MADVKLNTLKEDVELARSLAFGDFVDINGEDRNSTVKALDTVAKLELELKKDEDELELKRAEAKFKEDLENRRFEFEKSLQEEKQQLERDRLELDKQKAKAEAEDRQKRQRLDMFRTGVELTGAAVSTGISYKVTKDLILADDRPRIIPRLPLDQAKKCLQDASRGFSKLRFR